MTEPDDLLESLGRDLPRLDLDEFSARRTRARAHELLQAPGWRRNVRRAWRRTELVLVAGVAAGYIFWAVQAISIVYK